MLSSLPLRLDDMPFEEYRLAMSLIRQGLAEEVQRKDEFWGYTRFIVKLRS